LIHVAGDALAPSILDNWRTVMDSRQAQRRTRALSLLIELSVERPGIIRRPPDAGGRLFVSLLVPCGQPS
jgi:hypothetical protein